MTAHHSRARRAARRHSPTSDRSSGARRARRVASAPGPCPTPASFQARWCAATTSCALPPSAVATAARHRANASSAATATSLPSARTSAILETRRDVGGAAGYRARTVSPRATAFATRRAMSFTRPVAGDRTRPSVSAAVASTFTVLRLSSTIWFCFFTAHACSARSSRSSKRDACAAVFPSGSSSETRPSREVPSAFERERLERPLPSESSPSESPAHASSSSSSSSSSSRRERAVVALALACPPVSVHRHATRPPKKPSASATFSGSNVSASSFRSLYRRTPTASLAFVGTPSAHASGAARDARATRCTREAPSETLAIHCAALATSSSAWRDKPAAGTTSLRFRLRRRLSDLLSASLFAFPSTPSSRSAAPSPSSPAAPVVPTTSFVSSAYANSGASASRPGRNSATAFRSCLCNI